MKRKIIWSFALLACLCCLPSAKQKHKRKMAQSYPGYYGKTPTGIPTTPMAAAFFTTKGPTIGMANTKKGKPSCPNGLRGNATAPT